VPAHDTRDFAFAKKFNLPIKIVIKPENSSLSPEEMEDAYTESGKMVNSGDFNGMESEEFKNKIIEYFENKGIGKRHINYRLRDWLISRQRYWGAPIPVIHCPKCGTVPVPVEDPQIS